jgi:NAD(P)-dependent dehydrogenase (short-subunit alcohol dehydrogenase family)
MALVTGATAGIGRQAALDLACRGVRVLVHARNRERGEPVVAELRRASGNDGVDLVVGDLASRSGVEALAGEVRDRAGQLDILINNAGVFMKERVLTEDGFETTFATNHLAPFLLTGHLLDTLERARSARIINVASMAHEGGRLDFDNLQGERFYDGFSAYALSKLANVLFTMELAERLRDTAITVNCLHPGVVTTRLLTEGFGLTGIPVERSTRCLLHLALAPEVQGITGAYFVDCRPASMATLAREALARGAFWEQTERLVGPFRAGAAAPPGWPGQGSQRPPGRDPGQ